MESKVANFSLVVSVLFVYKKNSMKLKETENYNHSYSCIATYVDYTVAC